RLAQGPPLVGQAAQLRPDDRLVVAPPRGPDGQGEPAPRSRLLDSLTPERPRAARGQRRPGAVCLRQLRSPGGATADQPAEANALAHRSAQFQVLGMGASHRTLDPAWDRLLPHFNGTYRSFDSDTRAERLHDAFPPATLKRLQALKRRYDPENVFRDNFAI